MVTREWFTVAELQAAQIPTLHDGFLATLEADFTRLQQRNLARVRHGTWNRNLRCIEREFHHSLFLKIEQLHLQNVLCTGIFGRILKLGLHRPVSDPRVNKAHSFAVPSETELRRRMRQDIVR